MKRVEEALNMIESGIKGKRILEIACGCGEFSLAASNIASEVKCIDLDSFRLSKELEDNPKITFEKMDARKMDYEDGYFNSCVIYNAIGHLANSIEEVIDESIRVTGLSGSIYIISSFKMDKLVIREELIPLLLSKDMTYNLQDKPPFICIEINK